ncbi:MAG: hypothetical protein V4724_30210 [Pseudomonadota bacterium]
MPINDSVFVEIEFFLLVAFSLILPAAIYGFMMWKKAISRLTVFGFGVSLIVIAGINVVILKLLADLAGKTPSLIDDRFFTSEMSFALYLFPALFAGIGINIISHLLISHLGEAERQYDRDQRAAADAAARGEREAGRKS